MAHWSNFITACVNLLSLLSGLVLIGFGTYFASHDQSPCVHLLCLPCLRIGTLLVVISLLGLIGSCCRSSFLLWLYLFIFLIFLIFIVNISAVLWLLAIKEDAINLDVKERTKFRDFTFRFHDQVMGLANWPDVKQCLIHKNICSCCDHEDNFFFSKNLKDNCCHQPQVCSKKPVISYDCDAWKNKTDTMCYNCSTCAHGLISQLSVMWKKLFPGIVVFVVFLIAIFIIGCRAFKQIKDEDYQQLDQTAKH